jgi:hypothetical protein
VGSSERITHVEGDTCMEEIHRQMLASGFTIRLPDPAQDAGGGDLDDQPVLGRWYHESAVDDAPK